MHRFDPFPLDLSSYSAIVRRGTFDLIGQILDFHFQLSLNILKLKRKSMHHLSPFFVPDFDRRYPPGNRHTDTCTSACIAPKHRSKELISEATRNKLWPRNRQLSLDIANRCRCRSAHWCFDWSCPLILLAFVLLTSNFVDDYPTRTRRSVGSRVRCRCYSFEIMQIFLQRFTCSTLNRFQLRLRLTAILRTFVIIILVRFPIAQTHPTEMMIAGETRLKQTMNETRSLSVSRLTMWLHPKERTIRGDQRWEANLPPFFSMQTLHFGQSFVLADM